MFYITLTLILLTVSLVIYKLRRKISRIYVRMVIKSRRNKRKALIFDDTHQQRCVQMLERLIRDHNSGIYIPVRTTDYIVWSGNLYIIFNTRMITVVNGKLDKTVLISDKIYQHLLEKLYNRHDHNGKTLIKHIEKKSGVILDGIVSEFEDHIKHKNTPLLDE